MEKWMLNCGHVVLLASYNAWMNSKLYEAAATLAPNEIAADRKAFFGSILGSLNHIVVGDTIWLKRFATHPSNHAALEPIRRDPAPQALDQVLFDNLPALWKHRQQLDQTINTWATSLTEADLEYSLSYKNMKGMPANKRFSSLVLHFFNHQTHHRGQATTLLSQAGLDVGATDLLALIPDE
ncbi:MAG: DinB family protein [Methylobacter sp.]